jgi:NAD(P)-dependent dehydrogenase (short-subunit alcohol dehydrogenase family)
MFVLLSSVIRHEDARQRSLVTHLDRHAASGGSGPSQGPSTEMWRQFEAGASRVLGQTPEQVNAKRLARVPLGRWEKTDDVAQLVGYLASDRSSYITGEDANVSGGVVMH